MKADSIKQLHTQFEDATYTKDEITYWYARDLQGLLEYIQWRNFEEVINKAKIACKNAGQAVENHFANVSKMVDLGSGSQ